MRHQLPTYENEATMIMISLCATCVAGSLRLLKQRQVRTDLAQAHSYVFAIADTQPACRFS
jgi:hypothetical protein